MLDIFLKQTKQLIINKHWGILSGLPSEDFVIATILTLYEIFIN